MVGGQIPKQESSPVTPVVSGGLGGRSAVFSDSSGNLK